MDFYLAFIVILSALTIMLVALTVLSLRVTQATRAELAALRSSVLGSHRFTNGSIEILAKMIQAPAGKRSSIELSPSPLEGPPTSPTDLAAPLLRDTAALRPPLSAAPPASPAPPSAVRGDPQPTIAHEAPFQRRALVDAEIPERLDELLRMVEEQIHVPEEAIPTWLRASGQPIGIQKLAVLMQDPTATPEDFDPLWVQTIENLSRTNPNAPLGEIVGEFNRLAALEEAPRQSPLPPMVEDVDTAARVLSSEEGRTHDVPEAGPRAHAYPDRPWFEGLFREYFSSVFVTIQWLGVPAESIDEVTQDVFRTIFNDLDPWVKSLTYRIARAHLELNRRQDHLTQSAERSTPPPVSDPDPKKSKS